MNLKKTMSFNKIKNISIEDSIVKINDTNEIENEFSVKTIQKIYLKAYKHNKYIYCGLITIFAAIVFIYLSVKIAIIVLCILIITTIIANFSLNQKKYFLCIKLKGNNNIYSIPFKTKRKDEMLNVIWEIRRRQLKANLAIN
jgi:hypothetical protein